MAKTSFGTTDIYKVSVGDLYNITKISIGDKLVYTAGNTVTYHVDTGAVYTEDVDADESVLRPTSFSPTKTGWEFVGWRRDSNAEGSVLQTLNMGDDPITLYAVFRQALTVTYYSPAKHEIKETKFYNNGNLRTPKFTISPNSYSGWTFRGWTKTSAPNGDIVYTSVNNTEIGDSVTLYQSFSQVITLTAYSTSTTPTKYTGTAYGNGGIATNVNPTFTVANPSISGWSFRGWSTASAGNSQISYSSINGTAFSANATIYALYQQNITLSYNSNGGSGSMGADTLQRYYSPGINATINPTFTIKSNSFSRSGYSFTSWRLNNSSTGQVYSAGSKVTLSANGTLYAQWQINFNPATDVSISSVNFTYTYVHRTDGTFGPYNVPTSISGKNITYTLPNGRGIYISDFSYTCVIKFKGKANFSCKASVGLSNNIFAGFKNTDDERPSETVYAAFDGTRGSVYCEFGKTANVTIPGLPHTKTLSFNANGEASLTITASISGTSYAYVSIDGLSRQMTFSFS